MRPVNRGLSPVSGDYANYKNALQALIGRIGAYCSYCERPTPAGSLEIEHIQPKSVLAHADLIGRWNNFLLACKNCNSTKGAKDVALSDQYIPDRDNTLVPFEYTANGRVLPAQRLNNLQTEIAQNTLALTGIDLEYSEFVDDNSVFVVVDRESSRKSAWNIAAVSLLNLNSTPSPAMREQITLLARTVGHFSIWMKVFEHDTVMRQRFIESFPGTCRECFNTTTQPLSPRPDNGLADAGKI